MEIAIILLVVGILAYLFPFPTRKKDQDRRSDAAYRNWYRWWIK